MYLRLENREMHACMLLEELKNERVSRNINGYGYNRSGWMDGWIDDKLELKSPWPRNSTTLYGMTDRRETGGSN
jgi:hypothetical protein